MPKLAIQNPPPPKDAKASKHRGAQKSQRAKCCFYIFIVKQTRTHGAANIPVKGAIIEE